jgi:AbrB family looped-hinge helix DNA binding protein
LWQGGGWRSERTIRIKSDILYICDIYYSYDILYLNDIFMEKPMKSDSFKSRINENGRIVIPAEIRKEMGLAAGDTVVMALEDGVLRIESQRVKIRRIQEEFQKFAKPGKRASDELVADRREEARREMEEWLG